MTPVRADNVEQILPADAAVHNPLQHRDLHQAANAFKP
jgi:hypothetical protein